MHFVIYIFGQGLPQNPVSIHADLDSAMREVHDKWFRPKGRMNLGWWWSPQMDEAGAIEFLALSIPSRQMTDAEMVAAAGGDKKTLRAWRSLAKDKCGPNVTDFERAEKSAEFLSGRFTALHVVREDRAGSSIADARCEGNDVAAESARFRTLRV